MTRPGHPLQIHLSRTHIRFLAQEKKRIKKKLGISASAAEIIRVLIEQHHMRMTHIATTEPESVEWFYRYLAEKASDDK